VGVRSVPGGKTADLGLIVDAMMAPSEARLAWVLARTKNLSADDLQEIRAQRQEWRALVRETAQKVLARPESWDDLLNLASSEDRLTWLRHLWPLVSASDRSAAFVAAYGRSDAPNRERAFLLRALRWFGRRSIVPSDERGAQFMASMSDRVRVYRGTVAEEAVNLRVGVSWTIERAKAVFFAAEHGRFRNRQSAPILMFAEIAKHDVRAAFFGREEAEVLVDPKPLLEAGTVRVEQINDEAGREKQREASS